MNDQYSNYLRILVSVSIRIAYHVSIDSERIIPSENTKPGLLAKSANANPEAGVSAISDPVRYEEHPLVLGNELKSRLRDD